MNSERARGVALYTGAAALLATGAFWWVRAAPPDTREPDVERWKASALRLLPDDENQDDADTLALAAGAEHEVVADVGVGQFAVSVVCVGGDLSQVRVSLGEIGSDSGHGLNCTNDQPPDVFKVGLAGQLRMKVTVTDVGPVVFRYSLRATD